MLNLQSVTKTNKLYKLIMTDGTELLLKMPTQKMLQELMELQKTNAGDPMEALTQVYKITTQIINLNIQGKRYSVEEIEEMLDMNMCVMVIQDYLQEMVKILGE